MTSLRSIISRLEKILIDTPGTSNLLPQFLKTVKLQGEQRPSAILYVQKSKCRKDTEFCKKLVEKLFDYSPSFPNYNFCSMKRRTICLSERVLMKFPALMGPEVTSGLRPLSCLSSVQFSSVAQPQIIWL